MNRVSIQQFLDLSHIIPVIDVRSPGEFEQGHIPGAVNIPLFNNEERAIVGTKYSREGHKEAIIEGIRLSGPAMHTKLKEALKTARNGELLVHCWRGGMRSEAMAWLFSMADINCKVLEGGYKSYRRLVLESFAGERKMIVLGGMTGSGKTEVLRYLKKTGNQVIDLEELARHKGSAFGSLDRIPQPTTEQFENDLFTELQQIDPEKPLWLEDESRNIGTVFLNDAFFNSMQRAKTIILFMDIETRMPRLLEEYSKYPAELLKASIIKISRRMGGDNAKAAVEAIDSGNIAKAIGITLTYYDKTYQHSIKSKNNPEIVLIETDTDDVKINAGKVLKAAGV